MWSRKLLTLHCNVKPGRFSMLGGNQTLEINDAMTSPAPFKPPLSDMMTHTTAVCVKTLVSRPSWFALAQSVTSQADSSSAPGWSMLLVTGSQAFRAPVSHCHVGKIHLRICLRAWAVGHHRSVLPGGSSLCPASEAFSWYRALHPLIPYDATQPGGGAGACSH